MATKIEAAKHLVYHAAWLKDNNLPFMKEAAMAKLFSSEMAMYVTTEAIQIFGGYGYIKEYPMELNRKPKYFSIFWYFSIF